MSDEDDRALAVTLYLETLKARMEPEHYERLAQLVRETACLIGQGQVFGDEDTQSDLPPEVQSEFAAVLAIMLTGRMDYSVVDMSDPGAATYIISVDPSIADDPAQMRVVRNSLRAWADDVREWADEQDDIDTELDGIARASESDEDD